MTVPLMCVLEKPSILQQRDSDYILQVLKEKKKICIYLKWEVLSSFGENIKDMRVEMRIKKEEDEKEDEKKELNEEDKIKKWRIITKVSDIKKEIKEKEESCLTATFCSCDSIHVIKGIHYEIRIVIDCKYPAEHFVISNVQSMFISVEAKAIPLHVINHRGHYDNYSPKNLLIHRTSIDNNKEEFYYASDLNSNFKNENDYDWIIFECKEDIFYENICYLRIQTNGDAQAPKIMKIEMTDDYRINSKHNLSTNWFLCEPHEIRLKNTKSYQQIDLKGPIGVDSNLITSKFRFIRVSFLQNFGEKQGCRYVVKSFELFSNQ
ncbi:hypothetical protein RFI_30717 [Reticulomyxa filosa]|uniref:Uncharacterized protein n=1 Tax=Reticulomyxa filosa TaxID=46433 RepID=X6LZS8_RETFI|nr:hypothetical protein RFI_30717 [Reticulomyxa filosa]|eukprot:ETO06672.1 hypothetical protein RFI_30717 [Reticulomyxa filosa]